VRPGRQRRTGRDANVAAFVRPVVSVLTKGTQPMVQVVVSRAVVASKAQSEERCHWRRPFFRVIVRCHGDSRRHFAKLVAAVVVGTAADCGGTAPVVHRAWRRIVDRWSPPAR
jgi:hypothetical protein